VLVVDAEGRLLLLRGSDPGRPGSRYWYTVGGGLAPGESDAQGAARELYEETGLRADPSDLVPLFEDVTDFPYEGTWYRQRQMFFVLRVAEYQVPADLLALAPRTVGPGGGDEHTIDEYRWWTVADLTATDERVYPPDLVATLDRILGAA
jgi:8-oxo-dGTP pyrophosphatase MutT (NUDIX family)